MEANRTNNKPNIIFILADDYGWDDIGYHNHLIHTPNLDRLASEGVKLENYYVQPICSPSREQLMTGRYQIRYGLQHGIIRNDRPHGLPLDEVTLPQRLKEIGYSTYMVGKWHLGFCKKEYTPLYRGFDKFYGFLTGSEDYWTHRRYGWYSGLDLRDQEKPALDENGTYSTHLFAKKASEMILKHKRSQPMFLYLSFQAVHGPRQVPETYLQEYMDINDNFDRIYAAQVTAMDEAVGNVTKALKTSGHWDNTVLIFSTDNGASKRVGSNWPLRGWKNTLWEGGVRGIGFVTSNLLEKTGRKSDALIHISDWFPTLLRISNGSTTGTKPLDGFDVWDAISTGKTSPRKELLHNIDPFYDAQTPSYSPLSCDNIFNTSTYAALRTGNWKLVTGYQGAGWKRRGPANDGFEESPDPPDKRLWLFNIHNDPGENHDLSKAHPDIVQDLLERLAAYNKTAVPIFWPDIDKRMNPQLHGDVFGPWL
ncbi:arylsulfatase B-like [Branchiostoma floridae x Branchiostoma japonicum]